MRAPPVPVLLVAVLAAASTHATCTCSGCICEKAAHGPCECRTCACEEADSGAAVRFVNPWKFGMRVCVGPDTAVRRDRTCAEGEWVYVPPETSNLTVRMPLCEFNGKDVYPCVWRALPHMLTPVHVVAVADGVEYPCACHQAVAPGARGPCAISPEFKRNVIDLTGAACPSPPMPYECRHYPMSRPACVPSPRGTIRDYCPAHPEKCAEGGGGQGSGTSLDDCYAGCDAAFQACAAAAAAGCPGGDPSCAAHCNIVHTKCQRTCAQEHPKHAGQHGHHEAQPVAGLHERCCAGPDRAVCSMYPRCATGLNCTFDEAFRVFGRCTVPDPEHQGDDRNEALEGDRCCNQNVVGADGEPVCKTWPACGLGLHCESGESTVIPGWCVREGPRGGPGREGDLCCSQDVRDQGADAPLCRVHRPCGVGLRCSADATAAAEGRCVVDSGALARLGQRCCNTHIVDATGAPVCAAYPGCAAGLRCNTGEMMFFPGRCVRARPWPHAPAGHTSCTTACNAARELCNSHCTSSGCEAACGETAGACRGRCAEHHPEGDAAF